MSQLESDGVLDRRELLRRGAIVGGTLVWAAPTVQAFAKPAFAQTGSPPPPGPSGKALSFVVVCYTETGSTDRCCVKFEFNDGAFEDCEEQDFMTPGCGDGEVNAACGDCSLFTFTASEEGDVVTVSFKDPDAGMFIVDGEAFGKCGNPDNSKSGGGCVTGDISADGDSITFDACGTLK